MKASGKMAAGRKGGVSKLRRREAEGCEGGGRTRKSEGEYVSKRQEKTQSMGGSSRRRKVPHKCHCLLAHINGKCQRHRTYRRLALLNTHKHV